MSVSNFLKFDDLLKISSILSENGYGEVPMTISTEVSDKLLNKINEDFYYRNKSDDEKVTLPEHVDEVEVTINNIIFKYISPKNEKNPTEK